MRKYQCTIQYVLLKGLLAKPSNTTRAIATKAVAETALPLSKLVGSHYWLIRLAGVSGAAAVCLAAYGRHSLKNSAKKQEYLHIYESANQMHFIHSLALLAAPLTKRPNVVSKAFIVVFRGNRPNIEEIDQNIGACSI